jgi:hypothetical protein
MVGADHPVSRTTRTRRGPRLAFLVAILLALPSLNSPLLQDDVVHRVMLLDKAPGVHWGPLELYDFIGAPARPATLLRDRGFLPWFAGDDLKLRFFRPLSSAVLAADARLFGERLWASRLHSLLWFLGLLMVVGALHRRFLSAESAALGTVIYAVAFGHLMPVVWIAARHALICSAFSLVSFWLHVRARQDGWSPGRWLSWMAFAAALLAGEMGLGALALLAAWEALGRRDAIRRRVLALLPFAAATLGYLACYVSMDYGVRGSGGYVSLSDGLVSAGVASRHFLILVGELVAAVPSDAVGAASAGAQTVAALWALLVTAAVWFLFRISRTHVDARDLMAMRWLPAAAAAAALPGAVALIGGRVLTLALVPASGVVAILLVAGLSTLRSGRLTKSRRLAVTATVVGLVVGHLVAAPILRLVAARVLSNLARQQRDLAATTRFCKGVMVIAAAADPVVATYVPVTMTLRDRGPERLRVLSMAPEDHRIENITRTGFDLVTLGSARTRTLWERLYGSVPMRSGTRVALTSFEARVMEDRDGVPVRVRFDFGEPLGAGHLCFFTWNDGKIAPFAPPQPGEPLELPYYEGPMGW